MDHSQWKTVSEHHAELHGVLDRETVPALWKAIQAWQPAVPQMTLNLQAVQRVDSAGMALLIHLIDHAKKQNCHIMLGFVPAPLAMLFKLSNVDTLLADHIKESLEVNCG